MPAMANITVKKADGTTDVVYTAVQPSAGDTVPSRWCALTGAPTMASRPTFEFKARDNGPKTGRRVEWNFSFPETAVINGVTAVVNKLTASGTLYVSNGMTSTVAKEGAYQMANLIASALVKQMMEEMNAAT